MLIMQENATILAALRSGTIDYAGYNSNSNLQTIDLAESLQKTNPEIALTSWAQRSEVAFSFIVTEPPFNDVNVRHAMQMALDLETINDTYYKGFADTTPSQLIGVKGYMFPFAEWPEELKKSYTYDPDGAEALLDAAGYPRGADGVRFKTRPRTLVFRLNRVTSTLVARSNIFQSTSGRPQRPCPRTNRGIKSTGRFADLGIADPLSVVEPREPFWSADYVERSSNLSSRLTRLLAA